MIVCDLDDTLAPSKSPLPQEMAKLIVRLLERSQFAIISGAHISQFERQVLDPLTALAAAPGTFERLHLLPTCGTRYEIFRDGSWQTVYSEELSTTEKSAASAALEKHAKALGLWCSRPYGEIIEDRGCQITFSALGQKAPGSLKHGWDSDGAKKNLLANCVQQDLPALEVRSGGSTSIDITKKGVDKAYGIEKLSAHTSIALTEMFFIGDRLDPAGNDYPVKKLGVACAAVTCWKDTLALLTRLLAESR